MLIFHKSFVKSLLTDIEFKNELYVNSKTKLIPASLFQNMLTSVKSSSFNFLKPYMQQITHFFAAIVMFLGLVVPAHARDPIRVVATDGAGKDIFAVE